MCFDCESYHTPIDHSLERSSALLDIRQSTWDMRLGTLDMRYETWDIGHNDYNVSSGPFFDF